MPRDLLAGPRDLLAGTEPEEQTVVGSIADWLADNLASTGVSRDMMENARNGNFRRDAAQEDGFLDRAGSLLERGGAAVDQGIYNFLGGLGSRKARDYAATIGGTVRQPVAGNTAYADVNSVGSMGKFALDAGVESLPAMAALATPYAGLPIIAGSQAGNIAAERAANNGTGDVTGQDLLEAAPFAVVSTALDRIGLKGVTNPVGNTIAGRVGGAMLREGLTEGAQSGIEYGGGTLGTKSGFDPATAWQQMVAGGVAGSALGGAMRGGAEIAQPVVSRLTPIRTGQGRPAAQPDTESDWEGSLDDLLQGDAPTDLLDTPPVAALATRRRDEPEQPADLDTIIGSYMNRTRRAESGGNDNADNPRSSAQGRYQFTDGTWKAYHNRVYGGDGLADKFNVEKQERLMREFTRDNAKALQRAGIPVTEATLYEAHHFGSAGAIAMRSNPGGAVEASVVKANPQFKGMTNAEALEWTNRHHGGSGDVAAVPDTAQPEIAVDIPGADGSLLGRGEQPRIAGAIDLPEPSGQDWRLPEQAEPAQMATAPRQELAQVPPARLGSASQVTTARGDMVNTQFELRDLSEIVDSSSALYDQLLQPRDRESRAASDAQIAEIVGRLDPGQLGDSRLASTGAPIIGPDGQVESGNGRINALAQIYARNPQGAQAYRQMIEARGLDTTGMERPVLVRRRITEMSPQQRQAWTRNANERETMAMSSTEQATADARAMPDTVLTSYRGGDVTAAANRDFVRSFIASAVSPAERNAMMAADGSLSVDGVRRIRFALMARAYGDTGLIAKIAEDTDANIAAIGKALLEAAPAMAQLRAAVQAGEVPEQYDISAAIAEAAGMVSRSRETGQSLVGMLAQTDAFAAPPSPEMKEVLRLFFRDAELKRARSGPKIADALIGYAKNAERLAEMAAQGPDMLGNIPTMPEPAELLRDARLGIDGDTEAQIDLLAPQPETGYTAPDEQAGGPTGQPAEAMPDGGEQDGGPRGTVPTLARGQLRALGIAAQLRTEKAAALVGRTAATPRELAEIAQVYRDPRYETFRIFLTKGDTIVHATGVSSRSVGEAPLMPKDMDSATFYTSIARAMADSGADGYYLLHNHPSGDPSPSQADRDVTRHIARAIPGFRAHVVINSNKFARIVVDAAGRSQSNTSTLNTGEDRLHAAAMPHDVLGRPIGKGGDLVALGKELQKPGWITVIGTDSRDNVRVVLDYPADALKRDTKALMAMARRVQSQSGSARLFLIGDRAALSSPVVARALSSGIVTGAVDENGAMVEAKGAGKARNKMPQPPARRVAEDRTPFNTDPAPEIQSKLIDKEGFSRDAQLIKSVIGSPFKTLKAVAKSGLADNARAAFYTMDSRMRAYAKRYNSKAITELANHFHAQAGTGGPATTETYHEAVDREGLGRAGQAWRILEPFIGNKAAMERITRMLRLPGERTRGRKAEAEAAAKIAKLLKDTLEYRRAAGEDIGEVTTGYFPRMLDVEKVVKNRDMFLRNATELFKRHDAPNPRASAEAWLARTFDQYAGIDGGLDLIDLFHDTRPAGVGRSTTKPRKFGEDADKLLANFYQNETGEVLTAYFIGGARKAEESRRFGDEKLKALFDRIQDDIRKSEMDGGDAIPALARMVATNLGRIGTPSERVRATTSFLHTASQLGTLDRATITSLSESMMGFVRAGPKYGLPMVTNSAIEFARQLRKAPPSEAARMAEALGIAQDAIIGEALSARAGFERGQTTRRAHKVQAGFFRSTGLEQWTNGTRIAATRMGQEFMRQLALDMKTGKAASAKQYLNELGITDPAAFAKWLNAGGNPSVEQLLGQEADPMAQQYRAGLVRFVNQTIMKPSRAEKPRWSSHPVGGMFFALMSYSYGFKKNVLDRTGRMIVRSAKEGNPALLYPAFGMAGLFAAHTVINNVLRQAIFGGGREDDEEEITFVDWIEALDRAGMFGPASPLLNAIWGLKYRRGTMESLAGPVIGRPLDLVDKTVGLATDANSKNTNTAERAAAGALYDIILEPAVEAYGISRFGAPIAGGIVWGTGNREGGMFPADRDAFVEAVAGPKAE